MADLTDYYGRAAGAESPDGRDNDAGSGAFSKFQFMPATAAAYAQRTPWGKGMGPDEVKAAVKANPALAKDLMDGYTADSTATLGRAGLPVNNTNLFALHRFGPAGGVSLLNAPAAMPVADWVRSVNWGNGVSPDAVIKQNGLDLYANVDAVRKRFIANQIGGAAPAPEAAIAPVAAAAPAAPSFQAPQPQVNPAALASLFADDGGDDAQRQQLTRQAQERKRRQALFAG